MGARGPAPTSRPRERGETGERDPDPMVPIGALDMLDSVAAAQLWPLVSPLLSDHSRGVRVKAASLLAVVPTANQPAADREHNQRET
jgi:hypothetical protein